MLVKTYSSTVRGIDAIKITVEVDASVGFKFFMVGLPDNAVKESEQRIAAAFANNAIKPVGRKIVVNLAPADIRKEGSHYDLPIAIGILAASEKIKAENISRYVILGELSLDGSVGVVEGALPIAIMALKEGFDGVILPRVNAREAAVVQGINVFGVDTLSQAIEVIEGRSSLEPTYVDTRGEYFSNCKNFDIDFQDVKGQEAVKRALEIAAAGGHNVLMVGPPGSGKSMLSRRMPTITPPMTLAEALESTKIHSVAGRIGASGGLLTSRPFRAPHHTLSDVAMVGGGSSPKPGEISLAHNGILFLDELPEFSRQVLEVLRGPLEDREIEIARSKYSVRYPANFMFIAAMNPCPCGYLTHPDKECRCTPAAVNRYMSKISGPLLDRIDMHIEVVPVDADRITATKTGQTSATIRARVVAARERQTARFEGTAIHSNAMMGSKQLDEFCPLDAESTQLLRDAINNLHLSARAHDRIIKLARTIADLEGVADIAQHHIGEAVSYRNFDRENWGVF
ncbi:MAG: YifB family Mg chelatase-like AAA ATPase [Mucinivorans sp.]